MPLRMIGKKGKGIQEISGTHMFHVSSFMVNMPFTKPLFKDLAAAKSLQSCPTLYNPMDGSPRGSPVPGILQARTLEWVAISFSNA